MIVPARCVAYYIEQSRTTKIEFLEFLYVISILVVPFDRIQEDRCLEKRWTDGD